MNSQDFCYWLKGVFELTDTDKLSKQQVQVIKNHLDLVFNKVTPDIDVKEKTWTEIIDDLLKEKKDKKKDDDIRIYPPYIPEKKSYEYPVTPGMPPWPIIICSGKDDGIVDRELFCLGDVTVTDDYWRKHQPLDENDYE